MSKRSSTILRRGILTALALAASSSPSWAVLIQSTATQSFSDTHSQSDTLATSNQADGSSTSTDNYGSALNFNQFDTTQGVLTGAKLKITTTARTPSGSLSASGGSGGRTANGSNGSTENIIAPNGESFGLGTLSGPNLSCSSSGNPCSTGNPGATTNTNLSHNVASGNLSLYAGGGTVSLQPSANLSARASTSGATPFTSVTDSYTLGWSGTLGIDYSYVYHATPSFDGGGPLDTLTIDFGTVAQNSGGGQLQNGFSIYNLIANSDAANTADLKLATIDGSGSVGSLFSDVAGFDGLGSGSSSFFDVFFDTTAIGAFQTDYTLALFDDVNGIGINSYNLHLILTGDVVQPLRTRVPEPSTLALLASGLASIAAARRRRKARSASV